MLKKRISHLKQKLALTIIYCITVLLFWCFNIPCVFMYFFNTPCPGCGMTRAISSAIQFDFISAFSYHPMFFSIPILYLYFLLDDGLFKSKNVNRVILTLIGIGFLLQWLEKLSFFSFFVDSQIFI